MADTEQTKNTHAEKSDDEKLAKVREIIKDIDFAMLTTIEEDGRLHSRPMSNNGEVEFDGDLWFFTFASSHKVLEIEREYQVNASFADTHKQSYVSMTGTAQIVRDKAKFEELWKPELKIWFPDGPDTPDLALIKVEVERAEYWDSPGKLAFGIAMVKSLATGKPPTDMGENEKVAIG